MSGIATRRTWATVVVLLAVPVLSAMLSADRRASSESPLRRFELARVGKVHPELYRLARGDFPRDPRVATSDEVKAGADPETVTVSAVPMSTGSNLLADLEAIGLEGGVAAEKLVTGRLPVDAVDAAGELDSLRFIRPEWSMSARGPANSQGDAMLKADAARTVFTVTGKNVVVGTLSDSFDCESGYAADVAAGELDPGIDAADVFAEGPCADPFPPTDEGRAMMQIIADVAPDATQKFHTARNGQLDYAQGIIDLKNAGAKVINDDYAYLTEPWFQDGVISQAIDSVTAQGVAYFTAAGNDGKMAYESAYREGKYTPKGFAEVPAHDFDPGTGSDTAQSVTIPAQSIVRLALQWDDNFKTQVPTLDAPKTDLDIGAFTSDAELLPLPGMPGTESGLSAIPSGLTQSVTLEPVEVMVFLNLDTSPQTTDLVILRDSGPAPTRLKWIGVSIDPITINEFSSASTGSIFGHSEALGAMSVGAANALQTITPPAAPVIEPYSSVGGGTITRDSKGVPLGADVARLRPNFVAPDNVDTSFFVSGHDPDGNGRPNFPGTSAAAPHAAAVAALALEKTKSVTPAVTRDDICNALSSTALDMGATGADDESGHGFIDANAALAALPLSATATRSPRCATVQLAIDSVTKAEGNSGTTKLTFKVTKLGGAAQDVTVAYATADGTAKKGEDYKETTGTLTFTATDVTKTVDVDVTGDTTIESDESFDLTLANATPANVVLLNTSFGTATIKDDDDPTATPDGSKLNFVAFGNPSKSKAEPGDKVTIAGDGYQQDAPLALSFHSTPVSLGSAKASSTGAFSATITIPDGATNGAHEIHAVGTDAGGGTRTIRYPITIVNGSASTVGSSGGTGSSGAEILGSVTSTTALPSTATTAPSTLPRTGGNVTFFAELGTILLLVGLAAIFGTRRREAPILGFDLRSL